ncbi:Rieske 2Fe-2S domain-containing protein [Verrucomicrobia bacterium]|nr:Rieske 2Fe-2S domain-containing protein [Verrucomicrobiota bacterium]MDB4459167.1 Rieske 2Fe-2S domain-containing protein [bacterium]
MAEIEIVKSDELKEGNTQTFMFKRDGIRIDAFVARLPEGLVAYENLCRHLPVSLDYGDGRIWDSKKRFFVCFTHGARYDPGTGKCVDGPCGGASLHSLQVIEKDGVVFLADGQAD